MTESEESEDIQICSHPINAQPAPETTKSYPSLQRKEFLSEGSLSKSEGPGEKTYEPNENCSEYSIEIQPAKVELLDTSAQCDVPMTYETPIQTERLLMKECYVQTSPEPKPI